MSGVKGPVNKDGSQLTSTEAVFAFMAWLTTREEISKFGCKHSAAEAVELINEFMKANPGMPEPRDEYPNYFRMPQ